MTVETLGGSLPEKRLEVVVTSLSSDAHTWNLVYLELLLEELGCEVVNLGACTPDDVIIRECEKRRPDLLVIGSLNGHGYQDGMRLIAAFRESPALALVPVVIGGKLDVTGGADGAATARLLAAGFDAVFDAATGDRPLAFRSYVDALTARVGAG
jgi:methylaspartate mutase sigma subunit